MQTIPNNQPCPYCGRFKNRGITIDAIIIRDNKILLIKRALEPYKDYWALPGGHIEWNDTVEETVKKEVMEETGLEVTAMKILNVYSKPDRDPYHKITIAYVVETTGEPTAGDDAKEYQWYDIYTLPKLGFDHEQIINDYLQLSSRTISKIVPKHRMLLR